jgi:asparagine synthase (glutamine-hydrolysing)
VRRKLFNKRARIYEILDNESVALLIEEHLSGKQNRRLFIWSLLNVEAWMEGFL